MKHVLVVDDTKNIRILLSKCLELEGYKVTTACDGQQALELFRNESYDLAFMDIKMPHLSGTEVLKRIREMGLETPVIIITAYATVKNAVECTQMGAVAYLQKPFTAEKVRTTLMELLDVHNSGSKLLTSDEKIEQTKENIKLGQYQKAIEALRSLISKEPTNPMVYKLFSASYEGIGDYENAKKFATLYNALNFKSENMQRKQ